MLWLTLIVCLTIETAMAGDETECQYCERVDDTCRQACSGRMEDCCDFCTAFDELFGKGGSKEMMIKFSDDSGNKFTGLISEFTVASPNHREYPFGLATAVKEGGEVILLHDGMLSLVKSASRGRRGELKEGNPYCQASIRVNSEEILTFKIEFEKVGGISISKGATHFDLVEGDAVALAKEELLRDQGVEKEGVPLPMTEEALGVQQQAARLTPDAEPPNVTQQTGDAAGAEPVQAGAGQMASDLHTESSAGTGAAAGPAAVPQAIVQGAEAPTQSQANVQGAAAPPQPQASVQKEQQAKPATAKEQRAKEAHIQKPNGVKAATETLTTTTTTTKTTTTTARRLMGSSATLFGICISFVIALLTAASLFMIVQ